MSRPAVPQRSSSAAMMNLAPSSHSNEQTESNQQGASTAEPAGLTSAAEDPVPSPGAAPLRRSPIGTEHMAQQEQHGRQSVSHSSSASSLRARASARGGVHMLSSSVRTASTSDPSYATQQQQHHSPSLPHQQQHRTVTAQRGTARPAAFVHESPRLRRKSSGSSRSGPHTSFHSRRAGGVLSSASTAYYHAGSHAASVYGPSMSSSSSSLNELGPADYGGYAQTSSASAGPPRSGGALGRKPGARGQSDIYASHGGAGSSSHSPLNNGSGSPHSPTGSYTSSRADTLDLPFEVNHSGGTGSHLAHSRPPSSSWALGTATRLQQGRGLPGSPHSQLSRMGMFYPQTRTLPFGEQLRILVTGGAGFVGSHLVDRLMMEGHEVLVMDNFFTGSKNNLATWTGHPNFELLRHDVVNPLLVEVDQIYHLACPASPKDYQRNEVKTLKTCFQGTLNMLGLAKRTRARFLLASTSEIYGDAKQHPQREDYFGNVNPTGWRACYDEGKRVAETLTYAYHQDGVDVRVARIFNTYGPNLSASDGRVVSNFLLQALKGQPLTVFGDGQQTRSFMYIADLIDGLIALMNCDARDGAGVHGRGDQVGDAGGAAAADRKMVDVHSPVNLGNPNEFTVRELVEVVSEVVQTLRRERRRREQGYRGSGQSQGRGLAIGMGSAPASAADALVNRLRALNTDADVPGLADDAAAPSTGLSTLTEADATPLVHPAMGLRSPAERLDLARPLFPDDEGPDGDDDASPVLIPPGRPGKIRPADPELARLDTHTASDSSPVDPDGLQHAAPLESEEDDADSQPDDHLSPPAVVVEYKPLPSDDPRMRCPEITRARELLGWEPRWSLHDGLMQTALYFERLLDEGLI